MRTRPYGPLPRSLGIAGRGRHCKSCTYCLHSNFRLLTAVSRLSVVALLLHHTSLQTSDTSGFDSSLLWQKTLPSLSIRNSSLTDPVSRTVSPLALGPLPSRLQGRSEYPHFFLKVILSWVIFAFLVASCITCIISRLMCLSGYAS